MSNLTIIGRAERIDFISLDATQVPAKIDTGADSSTIWVSKVHEKADGLHCVFFGPESPYYTGKVLVFAQNYNVTQVENSFGHREIRYKVKLPVRVKGRLIKASFTLSNRSAKTYPVLLGRRLLKNKFLVDVSQGDPLHAEEKHKTKQLRSNLQNTVSGKNIV